MTDLSKMSRKQLEKLIDDAHKALKALSVSERRAAKKAAEEAAAKFGFKLDELVSTAAKPKTKTGKSSPPKYANPADPSQTWSGKGRQPAWYREATAAGKAPADMEIGSAK